MKKTILIFDRLDATLYPGGDTIQINAIAHFLENQGHEVRFAVNWGQDLGDIDIAIIFNLTRPIEAYIQAKHLVKNKKPYILFPIFWDLDSLNIKDGLSSLLKSILPKQLKSFIRAYKFNQQFKKVYNSLSLFELSDLFQMVSYILKHAFCICPNSLAEQNHLIEKFGLNNTEIDKMKIIYNGVDTYRVKQLEEKDYPIKVPSSYICCVGGIGPRKNQLNLVKAAQIAKVPLVLVGKHSAGANQYFQKVKKAAVENVFFYDHLPQEQVFYIMKKSVGHIQPSFIETPGLASLEAGCLGCRIGVSNVAPVMEYFRDKAYYCEPSDIGSIVDCIFNLISEKEKDTTDLALYIKEKFDWNNVLVRLNEIIIGRL